MYKVNTNKPVRFGLSVSMYSEFASSTPHSQAVTTMAIIWQIFITIATYEKTDPLISKTTAWAVSPKQALSIHQL